MKDRFDPFDSIRPTLATTATRLAVSAGIGLCAAIAAWGLWTIGGHLPTYADSLVYDTWASHQSAGPEAPILLVDNPEVSHGSHPGLAWDHPALARVITALTQSEAAAIGIDEYLTRPSSPDHGGAAADALLAEAIAQSERAVLPVPLLAHDPGLNIARAGGAVGAAQVHRSWISLPRTEGPRILEADLLLPLLPSFAEPAAAVTHQAVHPDADGRIRRVPLFVRSGARLIPAFGLSLYLTAKGHADDRLRIRPGYGLQTDEKPDTRTHDPSFFVPIDAKAGVLLPGLARGRVPALRLPLSDLLHAVEHHDADQLRSWAEGRIVILPRTAVASDHPERSDPPLHHLVLLHSLFTGNWATRPAGVWSVLIGWLAASVATWTLLQWRDWRGLAGVSALLACYLVTVWLVLSITHVSLPLLLPFAAMTTAAAGSIVWNHLAAGRQMRALESNVVRVQADLAALREALVCQESIVEQLEEDLEAARAHTAQATDREQTLSHSTATLQHELQEAQTRESDTRLQLARLESELAGLRAVTLVHTPIPEADLEALRQEAEQLGILTRDARLLRIFRDLKRGAQSTLPVLILGESGTGKELFARAVHQLSPRRSQPFVAVNMAAISPELFESELFGHVRGSFTGATQDRPGYFELAARGTIFLDEVGDLRPEHQAKLLRVLQDRSFYRVGATKPTVVDVRIVAATNKDLLRGIAEGWFREDLYARLKGLVVALPPLRDRPDDMLYLADMFLAQAAMRAQRPGASFTQDAIDALRGYTWPHNVRELSQCLEQAVALANQALLTARDLRLPHATPPLSPVGFPAGPSADISGDTAVLECLRRHAFDMQATARALGWDRSTVTQRLKGLCFQALVDMQGDMQKAAAVLAQDPALLRTVELKLLEYKDHLNTVVASYATEAEAVVGCRKRFKNLPDRHFRAVAALIHHHFVVAHHGQSVSSDDALSPPPSKKGVSQA